MSDAEAIVRFARFDSPSKAPASKGGELPVGAAVRAKGLNSNTYPNGLRGRVVAAADGEGRVGVLFDGGEAAMLVESATLVKIPARSWKVNLQPMQGSIVPRATDSIRMSRRSRVVQDPAIGNAQRAIVLMQKQQSGAFLTNAEQRELQAILNPGAAPPAAPNQPASGSVHTHQLDVVLPHGARYTGPATIGSGQEGFSATNLEGGTPDINTSSVHAQAASELVRLDRIEDAVVKAKAACPDSRSNFFGFDLDRMVDLQTGVEADRQAMAACIAKIKIDFDGELADERKRLRQQLMKASRDLVRLVESVPGGVAGLRAQLEERRGTAATHMLAAQEAQKALLYPLPADLQTEVAEATDRLNSLDEALKQAANAERVAHSCDDELKLLQRWHEARPGQEFFKFLEKARKAKNKAQRQLGRDKFFLDDAEEDEEDEAEIDAAREQVAKSKDLRKQADQNLAEAFALAIKDVQHFPEQMSELEKLMDFPPSLAELWRDGRQLDDYDDLTTLSSSGRHTVRRATLVNGGAVSVLKEFKVGANQYKTFSREVQRMHELRHPAIMPITGIFINKKDGSIFVEMPDCAGGPIDEWVRSSDPGLGRARVVLRQVLEGIGKLHDNDIVHADLKPSNVLMSTADARTARPRLTDFETSKDLSATMTMTHGGGTIGYMAPEVLRGEVPSCKSDMYAFGKLMADVQKAMGSDNEQLASLCAALTAENPDSRPSVADALQHDFFTTVPDPEPEHDCVLCWEPVPESKGIRCVHGHFVCDDDFSQNLLAKVDSNDPNSLISFSTNRGRIYCPNRCNGCDARAFTEAEIARHASADAFAAYQKGRERMFETRLSAETDQRIKERLAAERKRWEQQSEHQRKVEDARRHITDDLLTLKCPRCKAAFIDFNGCCALKCSRGGCGCGFCAYCLKDCGSDAHSHVANCRLNPGDDRYFVKQEHLNTKVWRKERQEKVDAYLDTLDGKVRADVERACHRDFADLGLRVAHAAATGRSRVNVEGRGGNVEEDVMRLVEMMGVDPDDARHALDAAGGVVAQAAEFLVPA